MNIIFLALPIAIIIGSIFLFGFLWAVLKGQYDDMDTPAHRMLIDDEMTTKIIERNSV